MFGGGNNAELIVKGIEYFLKAETGAENKSEEGTGYSAGNKQLSRSMPFILYIR